MFSGLATSNSLDSELGIQPRRVSLGMSRPGILCVDVHKTEGKRVVTGGVDAQAAGGNEATEILFLIVLLVELNEFFTQNVHIKTTSHSVPVWIPVIDVPASSRIQRSTVPACRFSCR